MNKTVDQKLLRVFAGVLLLLTVMTVTIYQTTRGLLRDHASTYQTQRILTQLEDLYGAMTEVETGQRGYLITQQEDFLEPFHSGTNQAAASLRQLQDLVAKEPAQVQRVEVLRTAVSKKIATTIRIIALLREQGAEAARAQVLTRTGKNEMDAVRRTVAEMTQYEQELLKVRMDRSLASARRNAFAIALLAVMLLVLIGLGMYAAIRELQTRRQVEAELQRTSMLQKAILNAANYAIISATPRGVITTFNAAAESMLGYRANELVGQCTPAVFHDPRETAERAQVLSQELGRPIEPGFEVFVAKAASGKPDENEWTYVRKDGTRFPVLLSITALQNARGELSGFLGVARDITELKRSHEALRASEERYRDLFENSSDLIQSVGADGRFLYVNRAWKQVLGYDDRHLAHLNFIDILHPAQRGHCLQMFQKVLAGQSLDGIETQFVAQDGTVIDVRGNVSASFKDGRFVGSRGIFHDVTVQKRHEAALAQARDVALESARLKANFLANMSHEIRTPMNGVIGMTHLLLDTPLTPQQRECAETISRCGESLLTIINGILDFSKIEAGKLEFETLDFDLRECVEEVVELLARQAQAKGLEIATVIYQAVPTRLRGDPGRLRQVLTNLIGNAIKFTARGEIVVRVSVESDSQDQVQLRFSVTDTGVGISLDSQKQLFQAFSQGDASTTRRFAGVGHL